MRKKSSESAMFRPRILTAALLCSIGALLMVIGFAANPANTTMNPSSAPVTWVGTATGPATALINAETSCVEGVNCDTFIITLSGTKADWVNKQVRVAIEWEDEVGAVDYDLYIHKGTNAGPIVAESAGSANPEAANLNPNEASIDVGTGEFSVHVIYYTASAANQYKGTATVIDAPPPAAAPPPLSSPPPAVPGVPRYYNYSPGPGVGETAGEPTVGFNLQTKRAMYISGLQTLRVTFPETGACDALWEDVSFVLTSKKSLDPILWTDQAINRTFVSQLNSVVPPASPVLIGLNSLMAYTDDDGQTWTPAQLNPPDGSYDHQNVGSGPYPASVPLGNSVNKGRAIYYCSQAGVTAFCSRSDDGGLNFGPSRNPYSTLDGCGGIHGHVKVANDGTVYLPNRDCDGAQSVAVSGDAGETWVVRQVKGPNFPGAKPPGDAIIDPSIGIASDGTLYFAYAAEETDGTHMRVAVSHDKGVTWINDFDLGASYGLVNTVFPTAIAGDPNRAAVGFLGTTASGNHQGSTFRGTWYAFVAHTYDGGVTWTTVNATPDDPVQKESCIWNGGGSNPCRNLLDFTGITKDDKGRVLYAYADGCIGDCVTGGPNSFSSKATIAKQSGGKPLLAANDPAEPLLPQAACLSGRRDDAASYLRWKVPDNGGSDITTYKVFRGTTANNVSQQVGTAIGSKSTFTDRSANPAVPVYFYRIVAQNANGEGASSNIVELPLGPRVEPNAACAAPGVQVLSDPTGDATTQLAQHDITSVSMAEPESLAGKLVFTIQVQDLTTVPPDWRWAVRFNTKLRPPDAPGVGPQDDWFVSFVSLSDGTHQFTYGSTGVLQGASRVFTTLGNLDPASSISPDGTITLVLPKNLVGNPGPGDAVTSIFGSVRLNGPTGGTNETIPDSTGTGSYALRSATLCLANTAPLAALSANTDNGAKGVTVEFDASASSDPDPVDTIATYTFNWGDGSDDVVQSSPKVSHTFNEEGLYAVKCVVTDSRGKQSSNTAQQLIEVTSPDPAQLINLSTRASVQGGDNVLIGGFIINGSGPKNVILRGIGPSLAEGPREVVGRMQDPTLELYDGAGNLILSNDNWKDSQEAEIQGSGLAPNDDRESAIAATLQPNPYTVVLRGKLDSGGIALVEIYDRDSNPVTSRLANISSRAFVQPGDNAIIGGFIAGRGSGAAITLIRAIGPSLKSTLANALENPTLEFYNANGALLASNDDWKDQQRNEIQQTGIPPNDDREAAILAPVAPGQYTAIVRGANNTSGSALVEIYNLE